MLNRVRWLLLVCLFLLTGRVEAQPSASCDKTWFARADGAIQLGEGDFEAICHPSNTEVFERAVSACGNEKERCLTARKSCKAPTSKTFDELARCYRAAGDPELTRNAAKPAPAPGPAATSAEARAEGLAAAGAVSIVAQGVSDFLVQRAEQEVALYAATELQKALCEKYGDVYFPKSCKLLRQSEEDGEPVGLGTLRRALHEDLSALPGNVLQSVFDRLAPEHQDEACLLDVTQAFAAGVLKERKIVPLFEVDPGDGGHLRLHHYRVRFPDKQERCAATWNAVKDGAAKLREARATYEVHRGTAGIARAVESATLAHPELTQEQRELIALWGELVQALNDVLTGAAPKDASLRAVRAGIALLKELLPDADAAIEEGGTIAVAVIDGDWIGIVASVSAAENLGPILLCKKGVKPCALDTNARATLRLVGDVAAADSSAGVTAALERFAGPLGSWRRKYRGGFYLMANGYVGAKLAYETVDDARAGSALAPVLAVGLEAGFNVGRLARIGLFAQAIDVGNVSSVRVAEEDDPNLVHVDVAPDVTAAQLLAPGLFLTVAPWKAPFAVNLGFDWVPELRTVAGDQRSAFHIGGALVVDTPILEIYHD